MSYKVDRLLLVAYTAQSEPMFGLTGRAQGATLAISALPMSKSGSIVRPSLSCVCLIVAAFFELAPAVAKASVIFNWPPAPGWTAGSPTAGQTVTQSFTSVNPNDITVSINNSGAGPQGMNLQNGYPQISSNPMTGGLAGVNALQIYASDSQAAGTFIRTTVSFATPVTNLSFQIWDVDAFSGQFVDKISNLQALAQGGGVVGADSVTSAVPGYNTITGSGLSTVILGTATANDSTNQGTINIVFNGPITQFSFEWSNNDPGLGAQAIAIGPLTYTPVAEYSTGFLSATFCLAAILSEARRRRRRRTAFPVKPVVQFEFS